MLTVDELKNLIASSGFTPLTITELKNMVEILIGVIRNMPLRQEQKNALILQAELGELALDKGLYTQSTMALMVVQNMITTLNSSGTLPIAATASAANLASLITEALSYQVFQGNVLS
jgi:hypothetical protein